jgi:putative ABC transport system permease protein
VNSGVVSAGFFSTLGVPLRAGRGFSERDSEVTRTAILNEGLAARLFQGRSPIGGVIWIRQTPCEVVGVVADYAKNPIQSQKSDPMLFLPLSAGSPNLTRLHFLVRAESDPAPLVQTVRREVRDAAPGMVVTNAYTFDEIIQVMGQEILIGTAPLFPLIAIGMLLTTAGVYGVLAFAIARRSRELAVRLAIGATRQDVVRLVTAQALRLVAAGSTLGIAVTFGLSRIVRAGGGGGSVFDPSLAAFVIPVVIVLAVSLLATWIPSRRALRIDPARLLRTI